MKDSGWGREYVDPLMTYKVSADRDFGTANVLASYRYRTGGPNNAKKNEGADAKTDKTAEFKLTYPVVDDLADLELKYRWMDVEAYESTYDYTVNEVNAGLKFEF